MKLHPVTAASAYFSDICQLYESAFPPDERRDLERQKALFARSEYRLFAAVDGGELVGLLSLWEFSDFVFMEHLAVDEKLRGKGIGTFIMNEYMKACGKRILLEVEPPRTRVQKKRVAFYQKLGFVLNPYPYIQPPYGPEKNPVPMFIMSHPAALDESGFSDARRKIHAVVYGLKKPLE